MPHILLLVAAVLALLEPESVPQEPSASSGLPARLPSDVAARIGAEIVTMQEYADYLVLEFGRGPLSNLIDRRLLRAEAARRGVSVAEEVVLDAVEKTWASYLVRFHGDEGAFVRELETGGRTREEYRRSMYEEAQDLLVADRLCKATRVVTEEAVAERFVRDFGGGGERVEVRHIVLTPTRTRAQMIQEGIPAEQIASEQVEARIRGRMAEILRELEGGADFAEVAGRESHDISAKSMGGLLPGYNYLTYGPEFAAAVRAAEVGVPVGPVATQAGFHVVEVTSRVHTDLAAVRDAIVRALAEEPATFPEIEALKERLRAAVAITTF